MNTLELSARVLECGAMRHTPAGLPALELLLAHESEVVEAGHPRRVELTISAVALGDLALLLADTPLGTEMQVQGFLAPARKDSVKVKLHLQQARRIAGSMGRDPLVG
ncbi:primosomal replication protein N [Bordetella bronchiseptica]|uniref:primosomal replication protein N n=1 Tax=Bordetella bronchiseptica TaxID=518 RepID=UPI00028A4817|nr:primosomal replication protein N [Bordetella bronchiseptica]AUL16335.1 primosomal replication protein N [Bordetella bronchiseptica]AWP59561.1 primosomal replication protein N [Bordetella bronchiseptica]AWQ06212.1 primosomal replication protein N [Bordetella bronchiseptica]AZW31796.1 primosomal replication protein N [Bordetella bronchiseptica]QET71278.1 primosomal replication protein N [Bordetella bronchiseptica]